MPKHEAIYADLTQRVIDLMESGQTGAWMKPWVSGGLTRPTNASTKRRYTGGNWMVLSYLTYERGYDVSFWATYKQWEALGAQVRKGEKGVGLVRVGTSYKCPQDGCKWRSSRKGEKCPAHGSARTVMFPLGFTVFHCSQVDGWEAPAPLTFDHNPIDEAEAFFANVPAEVIDGDEAYYTPSTDVITLPPLERFKEAEGYYSTRAHETVHWTGHKDRLERGLNHGALRFGNEAYAREELVAELGAVFLMAHLGLEAEPRGDHSAYLGSWLKTLKQDPAFLWTAASAAEKAASFIIDAAEGEDTREGSPAQEDAA